MTGKRIDVKLGDSSNIALTAVALQDHWSRSLSLGPRFGPRNVGLGPAARAKQKKEIRSVIDTGNRGKRAPQRQADREKEVEYVLDKKPPPPTLAQKFGLVSAPKPLLSESEWSQIKEKSNKRDDSDEPCVICKEDFGLQDQVLLSCTHVFHKACLQAFERFTGRKTCPMCRHEQYQTRVIHEGARLHRVKCATKIQSHWRAYVVRSWYKNLRATVPPKDPMLRRKFYEEKMTSIIDRMVNSLDMNVAAFMRELDASVQHSRNIFSQWDAAHLTLSDAEWENIQLKAVQRGDVDCPICLTELHWTQTGHHETDHGQADTRQGKHVKVNEPQQTNNPSTTTPHTAQRTPQRLTISRKSRDKKLFAKISKSETFTVGGDMVDETSLPHIQEAVHQETKHSSPPLNDSVHKVRSTVLLSCSHVFHNTCLNTLEEIAMLDIRNTCPICRAHYQKKVIVF